MKSRSRFSFHRQGTMSYTVTHRESGAEIGQVWRTRDGWMIRSATRKREIFGVSRETAASLVLGDYQLAIGFDGALAARAGVTIEVASEQADRFGRSLFPVSGDLLGESGRKATGTLWERAAVRPAPGPTRPAGWWAETMRVRKIASSIIRAASKRDTPRGRAYARSLTSTPNQQVMMFGLYNRAAAGIIRAGVRVR